MKISLNWIKDYVEIPETMDLSRLAHDLTMSTVEVEGVVELARNFDKMVVGVIKEILPHPNADKLKICKTQVDTDDVQNIICGGINLNVGMKVAVACPGAKARWHGEGELVEISLTKIRGEQSYGMICTSAEIGLSELFPAIGEAMILDLSQFLAEAGSPLADALELNDVIFEIDNKSLTNRPDLWGHYGIAREISALYNLPFVGMESLSDLTSKAKLEVRIDDTTRCRRYIGVEIEGLSVIPSPHTMQSRIWSVGMRPVNALVDITNYVMLATGQPTHAFDSDNVVGHIIVRCAEENEKLMMLNGKELTLTIDDLVIADNDAAIGLAGVMGGKKVSVISTTNKVILEIANFEAFGVRRTSARFETRTEAATRYEKAIDPERCDIALSLATKLFAEIYPDMNVVGYCDVYPTAAPQTTVSISLKWLHRRLGKEITNQEISDKLRRLGFGVKFNGDVLALAVPSWRSTGDVSISEDIMEEIARMHGFENFEPMPITTFFDGAINQIKVDVERKIKEYLAFRCGMREIFTYPWMADEYIKAVLQNTNEMLLLATPPAPDEQHLRTSLLPNLCKAVSSNLRYFNEFSIFEVAQIAFDRDFSARYDSNEILPLEQKSLAGVFVGKSTDVDLSFRKAKGVIEALPRYVHISAMTFERIEKPIWADDVVWLNIMHQNNCIGSIALLSKKASLECGIKNSTVVLFEINLDEVAPLHSRTNSFVHSPEYPMTDYDVSMIFDSSVKWSDIKKIVLGKGGSTGLLRDVCFVEEYRGKQVAHDKKSVTMRLTIGSLQKTLNSNEIEGVAKQIIKRLNKVFNAEIRS